MACQFTLLARFGDINKTKTFLFPQTVKEDPPVQTRNVNDGWNDNWGDEWDDEEMDVEDEDNDMSPECSDNYGSTETHGWLQDCVLSLSPANDIMAVAYEDKIALLSQRYVPKAKEDDMDSNLTSVFEGTIAQEGEYITAVLCLPLASQKLSTQGAPDWTCVIVGFSSGYVRMYTETGTLLLSQLLHTEPITKLKCHTYESPRFLGLAEQHEELVILYKKALVTIDGFSLFQSLRACRNQVARATASGNEPSLEPPPLAYKKWALQGQDKIHDAGMCGLDAPNPFDQMKTASILGGHAATIRPTPPSAAVYMTAGIDHYVGFFYAVEGSAQPILSDVAYAVANKLKSAFMSAASGWLGFGNKQKEEDKQRPKIEPATPLNLRFGVPDKRRYGEQICLSPNSHYAAITDSFGRVVLFDVGTGVSIRMWKGYRDAQVGWVQVKEDVHTENNEMSRVAQFLLIYAPRRGILEVWTAVNGPRVAAFNVNKWCRLYCPNYGMLGLNNVTCRGTRTRVFQCALIDPSGSVKTIEIPFHLSLSDKNSKRARDLHLLKKLKTVLKETREEGENLVATLQDLLKNMKIASVKQQGLERIFATKYLSSEVMLSLLDGCLKEMSEKDETHADVDCKLFTKYCTLYSNLLKLYCRLYDFEDQGRIESSHSEDEQSWMETLSRTGTSETEASHIITSVRKYAENSKKDMPTVKFNIDEKVNPSTFLSCFHCHLHMSVSDSTHHSPISLSSRLNEEKQLSLAKYIFSDIVSGGSSCSDLIDMLGESEISPQLLMKLLVLFWLSEDTRGLNMVPKLHAIISNITSKIDQKLLFVGSDETSKWWATIREVCHKSVNCGAAYIMALVCQSVARNVLSNVDKDKVTESEVGTASVQSDVELAQGTSCDNLQSMDVVEWQLSVKQLDDLLCLNSLLRVTNPVAKGYKDPITVCVTKIMEGGRGAISEVVGCFATQNELSPDQMFNMTNIMETSESTNKDMDISDGDQDQENLFSAQIRNHLDILRERYPHSLEKDVLLCNCCWENIVQWNKEPETTAFLERGLNFLQLVQNAVMRQGVGSLLWHMFLVKKFSNAAFLMEKVGKPPKERLCRKEIGLSEKCLPDFVGCICELLDILMEANCDSNEVPVFNIEPTWQGVHGPASLVELAIDQKATNYGLLCLHHQLSIIMYAVLLFKIKSVRVISLFDSKGKNSFFLDLHQHPLLPTQNVDVGITNSRKTFLQKVITCMVEAMDTAPETISSSRSSDIFMRWSTTTLNLAKDFGLDIDCIKRQQVFELYSSGKDRQAEIVLLTVNDHELLGSNLLLLAGYRTAHYLLDTNKMKGVDLLTSISPTLSAWLKSLEKGKVRKEAVPVSDIAVLVQHAANNLPEGYSEYELAISLVDLVQSLSTL